MAKMGDPINRDDRVYTFGDYKSWPGDERWELIDGIAWNMSPAPSRNHQEAVSQFLRPILNHVEGSACKVYTAPFDVLLPDSPEQRDEDIPTVVQPDISVICNRSKLTPMGCTGPPDWIIEILSPYTSRKDMSLKYELYQRHGVREYWVVDPGNRYVHVYLLDRTGRYPADPEVFLRERVVPCTVLEGLVIDLSRIFAEEE